MLRLVDIEQKLNDNLTQSKIDEINSLEFNFLNPKKDITGNWYNRLLVIGRGPDYVSPGGKKTSQWWTICSCPEHNIRLVRVSNLTSGNTKSCGCKNLESCRENAKKAVEASKLNLTNKVFGKLTALYPTDERRDNSIVWVCKCECGNYYKVASNILNAGRIRSCGCLNTSYGEYLIEKVLKENNITFEKEKCFSTCKFPDSKASARFDFFINNKFVIEFDGEQHFKEKSNYFKDSLEKRQQHDKFKENWCEKNNIPIIRISYNEIDNINLDFIRNKYYQKYNCECGV